MIDKQKKLGQIFTPDWIVKIILDKLNYNNKEILSRYIFEPGCGSGNFLIEIVDRYINYAKKNNYDNDAIKIDLENYIYGIEVDREAYDICIDRLNNLIKKYDLKDVKWKIFHDDILNIEKNIFPKFDYIVGNPPYVRVHNLDKKDLFNIKNNYLFCKNGIIDLFLVFYEIGIFSLSEKGMLGFITPNSFIHNSTYVDFRNFLKKEKIIKELIDFKESSIFDNVSTYNAIMILDKNHKSNNLDYYEYCNHKLVHINKINLEEQSDKKWNFVNKDDNIFLNSIVNSSKKISNFATVQYGFATLLDKVFILEEKDIEINKIEREICYPVVKGSKYDGKEIKYKIIYPYFLKGNFWEAIPEYDIKKQFPNTYNYLLSHKADLEKRSLDKKAQWYEYGRSQGIQTMHNQKLVISPIFKDKINIFKIDKEIMVYSGIYLFIDAKSDYTLDYFLEILKSNKFIKYARMVGKDMSGGYKTLNTKTIKDFSL